MEEKVFRFLLISMEKLYLKMDFINLSLDFLSQLLSMFQTQMAFFLLSFFLPQVRQRHQKLRWKSKILVNLGLIGIVFSNFDHSFYFITSTCQMWLQFMEHPLILLHFSEFSYIIDYHLCLNSCISTKFLQIVCQINVHILVRQHVKCGCRLWYLPY